MDMVGSIGDRRAPEHPASLPKELANFEAGRNLGAELLQPVGETKASMACLSMTLLPRRLFLVRAQIFGGARSTTDG